MRRRRGLAREWKRLPCGGTGLDLQYNHAALWLSANTLNTNRLDCLGTCIGVLPALPTSSPARAATATPRGEGDLRGLSIRGVMNDRGFQPSSLPCSPRWAPTKLKLCFVTLSSFFTSQGSPYSLSSPSNTGPSLARGHLHCRRTEDSGAVSWGAGSSQRCRVLPRSVLGFEERLLIRRLKQPL